MARLAARSTAADDAAAWHIATLRARVKLGMVLRQALVQLGIDPATVAMLQIADEAAQELAVTADGAEGLDAGALPPVADDQCDDDSAARSRRVLTDRCSAILMSPASILPRLRSPKRSPGASRAWKIPRHPRRRERGRKMALDFLLPICCRSSSKMGDDGIVEV